MTEEVKLNLGAGNDIRPDFRNIDINNYEGLDLVADVINLPMIEDQSVDFIVAQHLLEYIPRVSMLPALLEWYRILKDGGMLEVRVTDLSALTKDLYLNDISKEMGLHHEMVVSLLYGTQSNEYDIVYNGFTSEFLQGILRGAGFYLVGAVQENYDIIVTGQKLLD